MVDPQKSPRHVAIEGCHEKGGQAADEDFAYCILNEAVTDVPIIPILYGCETQILKPKQDIVLVGYGNIDEDTESPNGHKRWVHAPVVKRFTKTIDLGDSNHTNCFGDSGGPAYVQLEDGTWRVFGATSTSTVINNVACAANGTWAYIPYYVPWIEEDSGLDITPCYDSDGTWNPGPDCQGIPTNPEVSGGTWAKMCTEKLKLSGPIASCGIRSTRAPPRCPTPRPTLLPRVAWMQAWTLSRAEPGALVAAAARAARAARSWSSAKADMQRSPRAPLAKRFKLRPHRSPTSTVAAPVASRRDAVRPAPGSRSALVYSSRDAAHGVRARLRLPDPIALGCRRSQRT